jgi:hypothetical protein
MVVPTFMSKGLASAGGELFTAFKGWLLACVGGELFTAFKGWRLASAGGELFTAFMLRLVALMLAGSVWAASMLSHIFLTKLIPHKIIN